MNKKWMKRVAALSTVLLCLLVEFPALAGSVSKSYTFSSGDAVFASKLNKNFDILYDELNSKETRISTLESSMNTRANYGKYAFFTMPIGTVVLASWATITTPLLELKNTFGSSITVGATSVTINDAGDYRILVSASDTDCNYSSAFNSEIMINGVQVASTWNGQCMGFSTEYIGGLSAGDVITIITNQGDSSTKTVNATTQLHFRIGLFRMF